MALKIQLISNKEKVTQGSALLKGRWFTAGSGKLFVRLNNSLYYADSETLEFCGNADDQHTFTNVVYVELNNVQCQALLS